MSKSANQLYKESNTTLTFKEWIEREKQKYYHSFDGQQAKVEMILNKPLNDSVQSTLNDIRKDAGLKQQPTNKSTLGVNNTVLIVAGIIAFGVIATVVYKKMSK